MTTPHILFNKHDINTKRFEFFLIMIFCLNDAFLHGIIFGHKKVCVEKPKTVSWYLEIEREKSSYNMQLQSSQWFCLNNIYMKKEPLSKAFEILKNLFQHLIKTLTLDYQ